ncbi:telomerase regulator Est1 [Schizosaccharomyces cryophilus OY26]|uniref:Telomerase regulator Est1 n=1 Tax=Schizosaccharomyces cryophilus (strain OY26 / ATCC MYA-4695 / CBS 11777 / NBRC 106824 / NRRL Y48691) TaxID=653667 RepID=S9W5V7_SCHCR|nr:telomerase regulator Est1 [Schizosaccharomyces cryophilus OY26]EPY53939.1 telomerase regulator Est1 [Schizosaccharomyces cryophilus OY26]
MNELNDHMHLTGHQKALVHALDNVLRTYPSEIRYNEICTITRKLENDLLKTFKETPGMVYRLDAIAWTHCHYKVTQHFKKVLKLINNKHVVERKLLKKQLKKFLSSCTVFYEVCITEVTIHSSIFQYKPFLQDWILKHTGIALSCSSQTHLSPASFSKSYTEALECIYQCFIYLGDVARYFAILLNRPATYERALKYYHLAHQTFPGNGMHCNQMAVIWAVKGHTIMSVYWFSIALASEIPPKTALLNLMGQLELFYKRAYETGFHFSSETLNLLVVFSDLLLRQSKKLESFRSSRPMLKSLISHFFNSDISCSESLNGLELYSLSSFICNLRSRSIFRSNESLHKVFIHYITWLINQTTSCNGRIAENKTPLSRANIFLPSLKILLIHILEHLPSCNFIDQRQLKKLSLSLLAIQPLFPAFNEPLEKTKLTLFEDYNEMGLHPSLATVTKTNYGDINLPLFSSDKIQSQAHPLLEAKARLQQILIMIELLLS